MEVQRHEVLRDKSAWAGQGNAQVMMMMMPGDILCSVALWGYAYCFMLHTNCYLRAEIKGDDMGGGGEEKRNTWFWRGNPEERNRLEWLGTEGTITVKWLFKETVWEEVDWINLAVDRDKWRAAVNAVMKFRVS